MAIAPVTGVYGNAAAAAAAKTAKSAATSGAEKEESGGKAAARDSRDTFVRSADETDMADPAPKRLSADQMKEIQEKQMESFKNMLANMLTSQADRDKAAKNGLTISADLFSKLTVTPEQQLKAQQAISEDGEWGVKAVATRIVDMAVALSGGDPSKISTLRAAVEKGFSQAGAQWGQELPSICQDTYKEIGKRFDYWEENGSLDGYQYESAEK